MKYSSAIRTLRIKYPHKSITNNCIFISNDFGRILQQEFPFAIIYTARSDTLDESDRIIPFFNHQISVIQEHSSLTALDPTRPKYEPQKEFWKFEATNLEDLLSQLHNFYSGEWRINQLFDPKKGHYLEFDPRYRLVK